MNPKLLIALLIVILISVWHFMISPIFDKINALKEEIASQEQIVMSKKLEVERMKALEKQLQGLDEEKTKLNIALPRTPNTEELMVEFESLVAKSGMSLGKIEITPIKKIIHIKNGQNDQNGYKNVKVKLNVKGSYDAIKRLLLLVQKDLRLMDVQKINFSSRAREKTAQGLPIYDFSLDISTYYY